MKCYTMLCIYDPQDIFTRQFANFAKFEDTSEDDMYKKHTEDYDGFNKWLEDNIGVTDDDVRYYLMSSEKELGIGHTFTDDGGLVWERTE